MIVFNAILIIIISIFLQNLELSHHQRHRHDAIFNRYTWSWFITIPKKNIDDDKNDDYDDDNDDSDGADDDRHHHHYHRPPPFGH